MPICVERHSEEPNLPIHSGTIRPSDRPPAAAFVQGLLSLLGEVMEEERE